MEDITLEVVGQRLRECRAIAGLQQKDVAQAIGIAERTVSNLERGAMDSIGILWIPRLAQVLETSADYLFGIVDVNPGLLRRFLAQGGDPHTERP